MTDNNELETKCKYYWQGEPIERLSKKELIEIIADFHKENLKLQGETMRLSIENFNKLS